MPCIPLVTIFISCVPDVPQGPEYVLCHVTGVPLLYCTCNFKRGEKDVLDTVVGTWTHNRSLMPIHTHVYEHSQTHAITHINYSLICSLTHTHHTHTHTHSPVDILHVNSAVVNGCMWLHVFWLTVAVVVGDLWCAAHAEHFRSLQEHEALLVLHTAVVDFKHRCTAGLLIRMKAPVVLRGLMRACTSMCIHIIWAW